MGSKNFNLWQQIKHAYDRKNDQVTPWIEAFVNALEWIKKTKAS